MRSRNFILSFAVLCSKASYSLPQVEFPIDAQLPPVAIAGRPFSFAFSPATFTSAFDMSYSAKDLPVWLQFEATSRTFVGTPGRNDVGNAKLELQASDLEGNIVVHLDLIVLAKNSVKANQESFAKQLSASGSYSTPNTLLLSPETFFDLEIGPDVFESGSDSIEFYATSENHAPLPAWIRFDEAAVKFSGTTPSLLTPQSSPQTFNFSLIASQVPQFSESTIDFQISVINHILAFVDSMQSFNVSAGNIVSIPPLIEQLRLDEKSVSRNQIATISSNQPDWLVFRSSDLSFYGQAPKDINSTTFRLEVDDTFRNVASIEVQLLLSFGSTKPQEIDLGVQNITVGQQFNYTFTNPDYKTADVEVDLGSATSWLHFERTNASIYGVVPSAVRGDAMNISATVSRDGHIARLEYLTLKVSNTPSNATNETSSHGTGASGPTPTQTETPTAGSQTESPKNTLALIVAIPIILVLLLSLLIGILIKGSRRKRTWRNPVFATTEVISRRPSSETIEVFTEYNSGSEIERDYRPPSLVPQISIQWAQNRPPTRRPGSINNTRMIHSPHTHSSWDDILLEVESSRSRTIGGAPRRDEASLAAPVHADSERSSNPTTFPPPLTSGNDTFGSPRKGDSTSVFRFDGRRISGLGHGSSMASPNVNVQRATLRSVPLSPLSGSSLVKNDIFESDSASMSPAPSNWGRPAHIGQSAATGGDRGTLRRSSFSSGGSGSRSLEQEQSSLAHKHLRKRTASTPFSGSLWEDVEWMTDDSASRSGNWHIQGLPYSTSQIPTGMSLEDSVVEQWDGRLPHSITIAMSEATSMRSHRWEESQSDSLRFI